MRESRCQPDAVEEEQIEESPALRMRCSHSLRCTMRSRAGVVTVTITMYSSHARLGWCCLCFEFEFEVIMAGMSNDSACQSPCSKNGQCCSQKDYFVQRQLSEAYLSIETSVNCPSSVPRGKSIFLLIQIAPHNDLLVKIEGATHN